MTVLVSAVLNVVRRLTNRELGESPSIIWRSEEIRAEFEKLSEEDKAHEWCTCYNLTTPSRNQEKQGARAVVNFHEYLHHESDGSCTLWGCNCRHFELLTCENTPPEIAG